MQGSLFSDFYLNYKFPEPQYLGSKYIHRAWIEQFIPVDTEVVLDAFGGSQSIAYLMKQLGKTTYTNDFLNFNYQIGKALIENAGELLTKEDIDILFSQNHNPSEYNLKISPPSNYILTGCGFERKVYQYLL